MAWGVGDTAIDPLSDRRLSRLSAEDSKDAARRGSYTVHMARSKRYSGVSRQVRKVQLVSSNTSLSTLANRSAVEKVSATLGFKARAEARQKLRGRLQEQYAGLDEAGRRLLHTIQTDSLAMPDSAVEDANIDHDSSMPGPEEWLEDDEDDSPCNDDLQIIHTMSNLHWARGQRSRHPRSWRLHWQQEMGAWNPLIEPMADAYIKWKYGQSTRTRPTSPSTCDTPASSPSPVPPSREEESSQAYTLLVYELFSMETSYTVLRPPTSTSAAVDFAEHGFLVKTPVLPSVAIGFRTLELFHRIRSRKALMSIEAFTRVICDYYMIPFRRYLRTILSETYEIYLRILRLIDKRIATVLGRNTPNWRAKNACTACCYVLEDEPELKYARLWAHDGNNSLKRVLPYDNRIAADTRVYAESDYILPREYVDQFVNEVKSRPMTQATKHREICTGDSSDESEDEGEKVTGQIVEGDPTDGIAQTHNEIDQCVKNWKAAASDNKKKSWGIFDETGIYVSALESSQILGFIKVK
ncbi:hypothetical protein QCA50_013176 [Cerrena zonata]|uniref:Uncharacterized protein n=1 Tax=Cerrena zonata TaxID=2478898 RepID=A0AAW0G406_9APHY